MRNWRIELLRGLAAFGIVGCHLSLSPRTELGYGVGSFCDMNVGLFAAFSGFLMSAKGGWLDYVRRRIRRLVPIYAVWTVFFILFGFIFDCFVRHGLNPKWCQEDYIWRVVLLGNAATHLWFLACLLYAQVISSALFRTLKDFPRWVWLVAGFVVVTISSASGDFFHRYFLRLFGFLLTGYGLDALVGFRRRFPLWVLLMTVAGTALLHGLGSGLLSGFVLDWILVVPLLLLCVGRVDDGNAWYVAVSQWLGETSFGVFLIHPAVTVAIGLLVRRLTPAPYGANWVLADWLASWGLTFALVILMRRQAKLKGLIS